MQKGFTLVELAIVMVIIGLLIGGVLKGQEMIHNAKINATIVQLRDYLSAYTAFDDKYTGVPGDLAVARQRIPNCTAATFCEDGNGNGRVGGEVFANWSLDQTGTTMPEAETTQFWKHLALADLIAGIDPNANPATFAFGSTHPNAKLAGGLTALYLPSPGSCGPIGSNLNCSFDGNMVRLQGVLAASGGSARGTNNISPADALEIDTKMDDGLAQRGAIQGEDGCDSAYDALSTRPCLLYYILK